MPWMDIHSMNLPSAERERERQDLSGKTHYSDIQKT